MIVRVDFALPVISTGNGLCSFGSGPGSCSKLLFSRLKSSSIANSHVPASHTCLHKASGSSVLCVHLLRGML